MTVSTSWATISEKPKIKITTQNDTKLKENNEVKEFKKVKNNEQIMDKITNNETNHISTFRTEGPSFTFRAGMTEIGGKTDACYKSQKLLESRGSQETGSRVRGLEMDQPRERPREAPGTNQLFCQ